MVIMISGNSRVILGIFAVIIALLIVLTALTIPLAFCFDVIQETCGADTTIVFGVVIALTIAIILAGFGLRIIAYTD